MPNRTKGREWLALALLCVTVAAFFWKLAFTNLILARGDTFFYIYPYWTAAARALQNGQLPLWNPNLFMGAPLLANSQAGVLYPLNWPLWLLFDTPTAASWSIVLHLCLAAGLSYGFARDGLQLRRPAAWLAALLFALGGYLTAQVEHINQLQGLSWLPAVFWLLARLDRPGTNRWRESLLLGGVFGLQLLAGHTQAAFITVVGAGLYGGWLSLPRLASIVQANKTGFWNRFAPLLRAPLAGVLLAGLIGLLLAAGQILPTLELSAQSVRGDGGLPLNEAISFSLHPLLAGRSLLPNYGETLFSEYVAFLPLGALLLALIGAWDGRRRPVVAGLALAAAAGLFFAFGAANPVYVLLVKLVPGFGLFRAPARWLALYAFGMAGLAGAGLDAALAARRWPVRPLLAVWGGGLLLLAGWSLLAPQLTPFIPAPPEAPVDPPGLTTIAGWLIELLLIGGLLMRRSHPRNNILYAPLLALSLLVASRALPYNHPTAPEAYQALRPATAHLLAAANCDGETPPGRFLSISDIFFDPGDLGELASIYDDQLPADAFYDLIIASKQKEILAPNLPLTFGVPAVDGYDGGVLPLANFVSLQQLLLPPDRVSMDGRLRENLDAIPDGRWLSLFDVRFLITDKVGDAWDQQRGVFYDLQHRTTLDQAHPVAEVAYLPTFQATELGIVLSHAPIQPGALLAKVTVRAEDGSQATLDLKAGDQRLLRVEDDGSELLVYYLPLEHPTTPSAISFQIGSTGEELQIRGLSLVDERDNAFQSLVMSGTGSYRLVHSGDVKIYENLDRLPRAFLVEGASWAASDEQALAQMAATTFDPAGEVVLSGTGQATNRTDASPPGQVTITNYQPELVNLAVEAQRVGWLVLSDAFYPGWQAAVDGQPVQIERADILFRAVQVPAGSHQVTFTFRPASVTYGLALSGLVLLAWLALYWLARHR